MSWTEWPVYSHECQEAVRELLAAGGSLSAYHANPEYGAGPAPGSWAWKLEREAELVHGVPHVVACSNGTAALTALLRALYPTGGEIITTALTFSATPASIIMAGLVPVFADVLIPECTLDYRSATRVLSDNTRTILAVDLFGRQATGGPEYVADSCQAVGLSPIAQHGVWSFNGRKNVPAGEGGAVYTADAGIARKVRLLINHAENFGDRLVAGNGRIAELTACVAYYGMREVRQRNAVRQVMARALGEILRGFDVIAPDPAGHAFYVYPLIVPRGMPGLAERLRGAGVQCQAGYIQPPLHVYPAFLDAKRDDLPNTEALSTDRLLLFPQVTPTATVEEMEQLGMTIRGCL